MKETLDICKRMNLERHIDSYSLGWQRICRISEYYGEWIYEDINDRLMYSTHRSWVYCITSNGVIMKIGETGQPLGIRSWQSNQPITGSKSRLGRYRKGDGTDYAIRNGLSSDIQSGQLVEIWAIACKEVTQTYNILGEDFEVKSQMHKQIEKLLLDIFKKNTGSYPILNCGRA